MRLDNLTPEQEAQLPLLRDEWLRFGLSTERMNKDAAVDAVNLAYAAAGLPIPKHIVFTDSPWSGMLLANLATKGLLDLDPPTGDKKIEVRSQVHSQVGSQVHSQVYSQVRSQVYSQVDSLQSIEYIHPASWGSQSAWWNSYYGTYLLLGVENLEPALGHIWMGLNAGWFWSLDGLAIVCDRPLELHRDDTHRLHNLSGPALLYPDGFAVYASHGVRVPEQIIERPHEITPQMIRDEENVEIRRVMIEMMGADKYLQDSNAKMIHEDIDELGLARKLWKCEIPDDEDLVMVECLNSTPEPDGSRKTYFLRVPPDTQRVVQGLAWMAQVEEQDYVLCVQT